MQKKLKFFRNIIANLLLTAVVLTVLVFTLVDSTVPVVADDKPINKGSSTSNVSLMVNIYWGTEYVDDMLNVFENNNVKTTFFIGGLWAAENDTVLKKIYSKGHEIGNHGYFHKDHKKLSPQRNKEEINVTHQLIKSMLGIDMTLFAPPSGSFNNSTLEGAKELGYKTIMWTNNSLGEDTTDSDMIYNKAIENISGGYLILIHPTKSTVAVLDKIIKTIKQKGLNLTPVSSVL